ncbi:MAG: glycosyltransferase family 4 protein [Chloroflexota bacterium]
MNRTTPPRHCMVVDNYYPDIRVEREARALAHRGHEVDIICLRNEGEPALERADGITVHRLPVRRKRGESLGVQLLEYVSFCVRAGVLLTRRHLQRRYDVVQVHNVPNFLVFSAIAAKLSGTPIILDMHDLMPEFFASRFGGRPDSLRMRLVRLEERLSAAFADQLLTVTDLWAGALIERGQRPERVGVVMNLPDEELFAPVPPQIREAPDPLTLVYHGTITFRYGIDILLRALATVRARRSVKLVLHGRGEYLPEVERLIDELGLHDAVEVSTALLPTGELQAIIGKADIGIVPNRRDVFTDGILPTKLMEYAALGIPAIVSRTSATEAYFSDEMVRFVPAGDPVALADAILELGAEPRTREALARQAQTFTEQHRWSDEAWRYVELVERLGGHGLG